MWLRSVLYLAQLHCLPCLSHYISTTQTHIQPQRCGMVASEQDGNDITVHGSLTAAHPPTWPQSNQPDGEKTPTPVSSTKDNSCLGGAKPELSSYWAASHSWVGLCRIPRPDIAGRARASFSILARPPSHNEDGSLPTHQPGSSRR